LFDPLNKITIDALIGPKDQGEREYAARHLGLIGPGDLALVDRGYPAFWLFALILSRQADFCARGSIGVWSVVDQARYPYAVFKDLYHQRWPVEEDYKVLKLRAEVENWSGKSALSIYQDFHVKVLTSNLAAILAQPAQSQVTIQSQSKKYLYQINFAYLLSKMKDAVVALLRGLHAENILTNFGRLCSRRLIPSAPVVNIRAAKLENAGASQWLTNLSANLMTLTFSSPLLHSVFSQALISVAISYARAEISAASCCRCSAPISSAPMVTPSISPSAR